ncbi:MAG: SDR family oxidoreductase [Alphaproteobacteria bacterium]|nr:SDR family oxidoreductase [Alphaproteobacteria bacterium]MBU2380175.1 SDR family oxidoreductase [Alphaproteobacteria bacterium]
MASFMTDDIPDLTGKLAVVTGSNSGTGFQTALEMARKGAEVVMAVRSAARAGDAIRRICRDVPTANVRFEALDLADQASVAAFADRLLAEGRPIDILVNNAGVMALPTREVTVDGFEVQLATNYLGHFALTARLLPLLKAGQARVVQLSSIAHRQGRIAFDDLNHQDDYKAWPVYAQSKLAMLMFGLELDRRSRAEGWGLTSVAAHPGYARTGLISNGPLGKRPGMRIAMRLIYRPFIEPLISNSAAGGALPILMAATAPNVEGGAYVGVSRLREMTGPPGPAKAEPAALDEGAAARLWASTEAMLNVSFA